MRATITFQSKKKNTHAARRKSLFFHPIRDTLNVAFFFPHPTSKTNTYWRPSALCFALLPILNGVSERTYSDYLKSVFIVVLFISLRQKRALLCMLIFVANQRSTVHCVFRGSWNGLKRFTRTYAIFSIKSTWKEKKKEFFDFSRKFQNIQESSRTYWNPLETHWIFKKVLEHSRKFLNVPESSRSFSIFLERSRMFRAILKPEVEFYLPLQKKLCGIFCKNAVKYFFSIFLSWYL